MVSISHFTNGTFSLTFGNGTWQLWPAPNAKTVLNTTAKWMVNGTWTSAWSPSYWRTEFLGFYLGRGLYWTGGSWVFGQWTLPAFRQADCLYYSGLLLNQLQAQVCHNATSVFYPNDVVSPTSLFNYTACNAATALAPRSYPQDYVTLNKVLYYEYFNNGSFL